MMSRSWGVNVCSNVINEHLKNNFKNSTQTQKTVLLAEEKIKFFNEIFLKIYLLFQFVLWSTVSQPVFRGTHVCLRFYLCLLWHILIWNNQGILVVICSYFQSYFRWNCDLPRFLLVLGVPRAKKVENHCLGDTHPSIQTLNIETFLCWENKSRH